MIEINLRANSPKMPLADKLLGILALAALAQQPILAEAQSGDGLLGLSFEELAMVNVTTTTLTATPWMSQPAVMTVMRSHEIERLGAKDMQEVLDFVPGFSSGVDVFGVNSVTMRGLWAHEGKVLLLLDDMPLNDLLYGSLNLARHYPTAQIERVEIVRGAGTARYGGNAQLAVIRLYSKAPATTGTTLNLAVDSTAGAGWGRQATLTAGWVANDLQLSLSGHVAQLPYSGETWRDNAGRNFQLRNLTEIQTANLIGKLDWRNFRLRYFNDRHLSRTPQKFGYGQPGERLEFSSENWQVKYVWKPAEGLSITPSFWHTTQQAWFIDRDPLVTPVVDFFLPARASAGTIELHYQRNDLDLLAGVESRRETAKALSPGGPPGARDAALYFNGAASASYQTDAAFAQVDWHKAEWLLSVGARYSNHSFAGRSIVPRAAATYDRGTWRLKAVAGQAFREPNIEVINSSDFGAPPISPETTTHLELELGWQPSPGSFGSLSVFDLAIDDPIYYSSTGTDYYYNNNPEAGTKGIELAWNQSIATSRVSIAYSHYRASSRQSLPAALDNRQYIGIPRHKLSAALDLPLPARAWRFRTSLVCISAYHAADYQAGASDALGNQLSLQRQSASTRVNLSFRRESPKWTLDVGVDDLFSAAPALPQPYYGESTPYPGHGRRFWLAVEWKLP